MTDDPTPAEALAQRFHEAYERLAPDYGYTTREASAVPWQDVPEPNRLLMVAVAQHLLDTSPIVVVNGQGASVAFAADLPPATDPIVPPPVAPEEPS